MIPAEEDGESAGIWFLAGWTSIPSTCVRWHFGVSAEGIDLTLFERGRVEARAPVVAGATYYPDWAFTELQVDEVVLDVPCVVAFNPACAVGLFGIFAEIWLMGHVAAIARARGLTIAAQAEEQQHQRRDNVVGLHHDSPV